MLKYLNRLPIRRLISNVAKAPENLTEEETKVFHKLAKEFDTTKVSIIDLSGGCGQMYSIEIDSEKFKGLSMIKQHRLVNQVLKEDVSKWHGLRIKTSVPKTEEK